jgi:Rrf2 family iron-sulfur cluster assembly transcriptional regulator
VHLSSQEEYGLRCLLQLARHQGDGPMRIQEIADLEGLTPEYVAKLMRVLRKGGVVTSTRGAAGGYHLERAAAEITLWDAIDILGGPMFPDSFCETHPGTLRDCVHSPSCSIRSVWRDLNNLLRTALSSVTVEDLKTGEQSSLAWLAGVARGDGIAAVRHATLGSLGSLGTLGNAGNAGNSGNLGKPGADRGGQE